MTAKIEPTDGDRELAEKFVDKLDELGADWGDEPRSAVADAWAWEICRHNAAERAGAAENKSLANCFRFLHEACIPAAKEVSDNELSHVDAFLKVWERQKSELDKAASELARLAAELGQLRSQASMDNQTIAMWYAAMLMLAGVTEPEWGRYGFQPAFQKVSAELDRLRADNERLRAALYTGYFPTKEAAEEAVAAFARRSGPQQIAAALFPSRVAEVPSEPQQPASPAVPAAGEVWGNPSEHIAYWMRVEAVRDGRVYWWSGQAMCFTSLDGFATQGAHASKIRIWPPVLPALECLTCGAPVDPQPRENRPHILDVPVCKCLSARLADAEARSERLAEENRELRRQVDQGSYYLDNCKKIDAFAERCGIQGAHDIGLAYLWPLLEEKWREARGDVKSDDDEPVTFAWSVGALNGSIASASIDLSGRILVSVGNLSRELSTRGQVRQLGRALGFEVKA